MRRAGVNDSIALKAWCVALGVSWAAAAFAQEGDGAARAQRDADNPLRMIIEAGKLKSRVKADEPDAAGKPAAEAKAAPPKPAPAPQVATLSGILVPNLVPVSGTLPAAAETVAFVPPPAPYDADNYFGVAPPLPGGAPRAARPAPTESAAPAPAATTARAALKLIDYVAPEIDERTRRKLRADGEVVLDFTVNPDGSVGNLAVRSASDRSLEPAALDAVGKWRYEPIAAAQPHGVQLVFKRGE